MDELTIAGAVLLLEHDGRTYKLATLEVDSTDHAEPRLDVDELTIEGWEPIDTFDFRSRFDAETFETLRANTWRAHHAARDAVRAELAAET